MPELDYDSQPPKKPWWDAAWWEWVVVAFVIAGLTFYLWPKPKRYRPGPNGPVLIREQ